MRKRLKKQLLNLAATLETVNKALDGMVAAKEDDHFVELLAQEQEAAAKIGNLIEQTEGEGGKAVEQLEVYCELLWQCSQAYDPVDRRRIIKKLHKLLNRVYSEIETLPIQYDIVFLPYKASMWDCMESIWMAAKKDENCNCYVIPIPYFDRKPDGTLGELHYEANLFPDDVPTVYYKNYSLEDRHPEAIYFHNPYDEYNYVTTVHPAYYSKELKKCTDLLVYVPYYILGKGPLPNTHLNLPAYQYMDQIILQDEEKKQSLINHIPEEKLAVLGSPKADRLIRFEADREKILENVLPEEWKNRVTGKKVFLYNVSLSGFLANDKLALEKICYVISRFENRKDAVLLWRPHPLIEATLKAMHPDLYQKYMDMKQEFKAEEKGILDETSDGMVSVILSDAYIGEETSSFLHYFGLLGKAIYITSWRIVEEQTEDTRLSVSFVDCWLEGDYIYFVPRKLYLEHTLCRMNLKDGIIDVVEDMPGDPQNSINWGSYCTVTKVGGKIILAPYLAKDIYIYDCSNKNAFKIVLQEECDGPRFDRTVVYKGMAFFKPKQYPAIVGFDLNTFEVTENKTCVSNFLKNEPMDAYFSWVTYAKDHLLYMPSFNDGRILILNMDTWEYSVRTIGNFDFGFHSITYDGVNFWLGSAKKNIIIRWNETTGASKQFEYPLVKQEQTMYSASTLIYYKGKILIFEVAQPEVYSINVESDIISKWDYSVSLMQQGLADHLEKRISGFSFAKLVEEDMVAAFDPLDNSFLLFKIDSKECKKYLCRLKRNRILKAEKRHLLNNCMHKGLPNYMREPEVGLTQFIDFIIAGSSDCCKYAKDGYQNYLANMDGSAGTEIHNYIKTLLEIRG